MKITFFLAGINKAQLDAIIASAPEKRQEADAAYYAAGRSPYPTNALTINNDGSISILNDVADAGDVRTERLSDGQYMASWNDSYSHAGPGSARATTPAEAADLLRGAARKDFNSILQD